MAGRITVAVIHPLLVGHRLQEILRTGDELTPEVFEHMLLSDVPDADLFAVAVLDGVTKDPRQDVHDEPRIVSEGAMPMVSHYALGAVEKFVNREVIFGFSTELFDRRFGMDMGLHDISFFFQQNSGSACNSSGGVCSLKTSIGIQIRAFNWQPQ